MKVFESIWVNNVTFAFTVIVVREFFFGAVAMRGKLVVWDESSGTRDAW